jgi:ketosteroid isomerase-like protein
MLRLPELAATCALLLSTVEVGALGAQAPGYPQLDPRSVRAEYLAEVLDRVNELAAAWGSAWAEDRPVDVLDQFWEDAVLVPPDHVPLRGHEEIRAYLESALPLHGHMEAFMLDFDASSTMAQVYGNYLLGIQRGPEAGTTKSGPMLTVYIRRGRSWKIRSQFFIPPG